MTDATERFLTAVRNGGWKVKDAGRDRWTAQCPAHDGDDLNLSIAKGDQGVLIRDWSHSCAEIDIARAVGLELRDLFDTDGRARYDYGGGYVIERVRTEKGKTVRPITAGITPDVRPLWTPAGSAAITESNIVMLCEGEKTADALVRLGASCVATWAGGTSSVDKADYQPLKGRTVVIVPDNDAPGQKALSTLMRLLQPIASDVKVWRVPERLNDAADLWLEGGSLDDLNPDTPAESPVSTDPPSNTVERWANGGAFIFDEAEGDSALWGDRDRVLWAAGESLMIYSAPGTGKTTLAGLLIRGRLGLDSHVLGMPVTRSVHRVLWLAMDRPRQISRALRRQFRPSDRDALEEYLVVWRGPLLEDLARNPMLFVEMAHEASADTLVIDSLKDAAARLAEDEGGRVYNIARQHALAAGIEILELHHARKASGDGRRRLGLDDVYGSVWISAGAGSIVALNGEAGDDRLDLYTLKSPRGDVSLKVQVDREAGTMTAATPPSAQDALRGQGTLLAREVARIIYGRDEKAEENKARRLLDRLVESGEVEAVITASPNGGHDRRAYRLADTLDGVTR